ncbi:hypothetical protein PSTT_13189, partial [Puccinia striiformis]
ATCSLKLKHGGSHSQPVRPSFRLYHNIIYKSLPTCFREPGQRCPLKLNPTCSSPGLRVKQAFDFLYWSSVDRQKLRNMKCYLILYLYPLFFWTRQAFIDTKPTFTPGAEFHGVLPDLNLPPEDEPSNPLSEHFASGEGSILPNDQMHMHSTVPALNSFQIKHGSDSTLKRKGVHPDTELRTKVGLVDGKMQKPLVDNENQINLNGNTSKASQSRQMEEPPIERLRLHASSGQKEDLVGPITNTETKKLCNFSDWSFVKDNSAIEIQNDPQRQGTKSEIEKLLTFLNKLKQRKMGKLKAKLEQENLGYTLDTQKHFWIRGDYAEAFFKAYRKERKTFPFPRITCHEKRSGIYNTILDIVDEKIDLEKYTVFSKDIVKHLTSELDTRLSIIQPSPPTAGPRLQVTTRIDIVKKITKCAVFLNLAYLNLFKANENGKNTVQQIESFLNFIQDLWKNVEKGDPYLCSDNNFGEKLHKLLTFQSSDHQKAASKAMAIAWDMVQLWVHQSANFKPHIPLEYRPEMVEIINKIVFYSNYAKLSNVQQPAHVFPRSWSALSCGLESTVHFTGPLRKILSDMRFSSIQYLCTLVIWTHQAFIDTKPTFTPGSKFRVELPDLNVIPEDEPSITLSGNLPPTATWDASGEGLTSPNDQAEMTLKRKGVDADVELRSKTGLLHGKMHKPFLNNENQMPLRGKSLQAAQSSLMNKQTIGSSRLYAPSDHEEEAVGLMTNTETQELCNFRDWSFVKDNSVMEMKSDSQRQESQFKIGNLLSFLNKLKRSKRLGNKTKLEQEKLGYTVDTQKDFWIKREYAVPFFKAYRRKRLEFRYPPVERISVRERISGIYKTILDIVDQKIELEKYTVFSEGIINQLTLKLQARLTEIQQSQLTEVRTRYQVMARIDIVKKITKCAVFLNLAYLTFFKEHENGKTTVQEIQIFLTFIRDLWEHIEKGENDTRSNNNFEEKLHKVLSFGSSEYRTAPDSSMGVAWHIVDLWVHKSATFKPHISLEYHLDMAEIINKIIFYSNYDLISDKITKIGGIEDI